MNKGLDALSKMKDQVYGVLNYGFYNANYCTVYDELLRLSDLDDAMKALSKVATLVDNEWIDKAEVNEKVVDIVRDKVVLIDVLVDVDTLKEYNDFKKKKEQLTPDEWTLLRKVFLKNGK